MSDDVSIKDVAEAAGGSKSTVSRVINGIGKATRICPATQQRVLAVARRLGYQQNQLARNISLGKLEGLEPRMADVDTPAQLTGLIGLALSPASPASSLASIAGLDPALAAAGYRILVITLQAGADTRRAPVGVYTGVTANHIARTLKSGIGTRTTTPTPDSGCRPSG